MHSRAKRAKPKIRKPSISVNWCYGQFRCTCTEEWFEWLVRGLCTAHILPAVPAAGWTQAWCSLRGGCSLISMLTMQLRVDVSYTRDADFTSYLFHHPRPDAFGGSRREKTARDEPIRILYEDKYWGIRFEV